MDAIILESCHSTWIFDHTRMRYRRILKRIEVDQAAVATEWRPYFRVDIDQESETFTVSLNARGSRRIRSWRHTANCVCCVEHATGEVPRHDVHHALSA